MKKSWLQYDDANMRRDQVGKTGVSTAEWTRIVPQLRAAKQAILQLDRTKTQGFLSLPKDAETVKNCEARAAQTRKRFSDLIVLGIGGSDLGARAIHHALSHVRKGMCVHFAGSSTDPGQLLRILNEVNLKKTCVNVVSKSGGTLEPMSAFLILRDRLKTQIGKRFAEHVIATTDPLDGVLRQIAIQEGYATLPIPKNVGGRFSVLSACGLFPAAAMGVDIASLLRGGREIADAFRGESSSVNAPSRYAGLHVIASRKRGQRIQVVMPYSASLGEFAKWVRQLVAESLGKKQTRSGRSVFEGVTPIAAVGPEDQHSQLQLYAEGPFDKTVTAIGVASTGRDMMVPRAAGLPDAVNRFSGHSLSSLLTIEREATMESLRRVHRPNGTIQIQSLDERSLGGLFQFYEIAVAMMGELLDVNAYDQPGVELSKRIMKEAMMG